MVEVEILFIVPFLESLKITLTVCIFEKILWILKLFCYSSICKLIPGSATGKFDICFYLIFALLEPKICFLVGAGH